MSNVVNEPPKPCRVEKIQRHKFLLMSNIDLLKFLQGCFPEFELTKISALWRMNPKELLHAEGELGNVVIKWIK